MPMTAKGSPRYFADTLWMLTSFRAFDNLVQCSAMPLEEAAEILITPAQSLLAD